MESPQSSFPGGGDSCLNRQVAALYRSALATVLLLPDRYARAGQMTQRIFEAVLASVKRSGVTSAGA